jgi:thioredoxin-related protein
MTKFASISRTALFLLVVSTLGCSTASKQGAPDTIVTGRSSQTQSAPPPTRAQAQFVGYENAVNTARTSNKLIFVDIYTDWCTWCHKLEKEVYTDPVVQQEFARNFALTKIDAEAETRRTYRGSILTERDLATQWNVTAYPTMIFLDQSETPVFAYEGYLPASDFVKLLEFVSSGAYRKEGANFRSWLTQSNSQKS